MMSFSMNGILNMPYHMNILPCEYLEELTKGLSENRNDF